MNPRRVIAVARRIALGFRRDHRSLALLFVAPLVVMTLVGLVWGSTAETIPNITFVTDRGNLPAPIASRVADALARSSAVHAQTGTFDDGMTALRDGRTDGVVWLEGTTLHITIEGSDPLRSGSIAGAVQKAFGEALASIAGALGTIGIGGLAAAAPRVEIDRLYGSADYTLLDYLAPVLIAFFAFFFIFLLSAVSFLRERTSGTLERLMATPLRRGELVVGYLAGFSIFALLQALVIIAFTVFVLKVHYTGNLATIFVVEGIMVIGAVSLGLLVSAAARNELQAVQFVPIVLLPQVFLSGLLIPVSQLPDYLRPISAILPLTYANEALKAVMIKGAAISDGVVLRDLGVLILFGALVAAGAIASIRREVA
jgi:ABC-2 type transport system permease protein